MNAYQALNQLITPVWILAVAEREILFANQAAVRLSLGVNVDELRHGRYSVHAEEDIMAYLPALRSQEEVVEIWTVQQNAQSAPLSCRLSLLRPDEDNEQILVEGLLYSLPATKPYPADDLWENSVYDKLFHANSAPMLLIDPAGDGRIVDANLAATKFYGYSREVFCHKHTWEINSLGREIMGIMNEVAKLPGGHRPLNFVHRMADGSLRDVQTYCGPLELDDRRLMMCIIHDVTEQKRLKKELEYAASRDPLTGLWNRRQFVNLLEAARTQKRRNDVEYSVLLVDADHFKTINDQYGHQSGDEVLMRLASTLENRVRDSDAVCRWGGEEFIVLLPQTDLESAVHLAHCLRTAIEQIQMPQIQCITVSIGAAQHQPAESTESLLKRADAALYRAKALGRNRVESS